MKKSTLIGIVVSGTILSSGGSNYPVLADDSKAIWGTDGAAITSSQPQVRKEVAPKTTEKQTIKSTVDSVKNPNIATPTTSPDQISGFGTKPAPSVKE